MLRAFVVLPVYLACFFLTPTTPLYQRFHEAVLAASAGNIGYHVIGYAVALGVGIVLALLLRFAWKPRTYAQSVLHAVFGMGLIGVMAASAYQLFLFYTGEQMSVIIILLPLMFMFAELMYEFVAFVVASFARLFGIKLQGA